MEKYATTVPYCTYNDNCGDVFFKWGMNIYGKPIYFGVNRRVAMEQYGSGSNRWTPIFMGNSGEKEGHERNNSQQCL